jgi:hypothetical protein
MHFHVIRTEVNKNPASTRGEVELQHSQLKSWIVGPADGFENREQAIQAMLEDRAVHDISEFVWSSVSCQSTTYHQYGR